MIEKPVLGGQILFRAEIGCSKKRTYLVLAVTSTGGVDGEEHTKNPERNTNGIFCAIFVILRGTHRKNFAIFFGF